MVACVDKYRIWNNFSSRMNGDWVYRNTIKTQFEEWDAGPTRALTRKVWMISPFAIVWALWLERNIRTMAKKRGWSKEMIIIEIKRFIFQRGSAKNWFKSLTLNDLIFNWNAVFL